LSWKTSRGERQYFIIAAELGRRPITRKALGGCGCASPNTGDAAIHAIVIDAVVDNEPGLTPLICSLTGGTLPQMILIVDDVHDLALLPMPPSWTTFVHAQE
jgi:hypothetical protein